MEISSSNKPFFIPYHFHETNIHRSSLWIMTTTQGLHSYHIIIIINGQNLKQSSDELQLIKMIYVSWERATLFSFRAILFFWRRKLNFYKINFWQPYSSSQPKINIIPVLVNHFNLLPSLSLPIFSLSLRPRTPRKLRSTSTSLSSTSSSSTSLSSSSSHASSNIRRRSSSNISSSNTKLLLPLLVVDSTDNRWLTLAHRDNKRNSSRSPIGSPVPPLAWWRCASRRPPLRGRRLCTSRSQRWPVSTVSSRSSGGRGAEVLSKVLHRNWDLINQHECFVFRVVVSH